MPNFTPGHNFVDGVANGCSAAALNAQIADAVPLAGLVSGRAARSTTATTDKVLVEAGGTLYHSTLANLIPANGIGADKLAVDDDYLGFSFRVRYNAGANGWVWMPGDGAGYAPGAIVLQQTNPDGTPLTAALIPMRVESDAKTDTLVLESDGIEVTGKVTATGALWLKNAVPTVILRDGDGPTAAALYHNAGIVRIGAANPTTGAATTDPVILDVANAGAYALVLDSTGLGLGTATPAYKFDCVGAARISGNLVLGAGLYLGPTGTPSSSADTGTAGQIAWNDSYLFVRMSTGWRRIGLGSAF